MEIYQLDQLFNRLYKRSCLCYSVASVFCHLSLIL